MHWRYGEVRDAKGRFSSVWKMTKWFFKRVFIGMGISLVAMSLYVAGQMNDPIIEILPVEAGSKVAPILQKIAKCESPTGHWENGQVVINATQDIGKYQINVPTWGKKATELGLNLAVEKDNEEMAEWIYANRGTGDWSSSAKCWRK